MSKVKNVEKKRVAKSPSVEVARKKSPVSKTKNGTTSNEKVNINVEVARKKSPLSKMKKGKKQLMKQK